MHHRSTRLLQRALAAGVAATLLLAACGDDDDEGAAATTTADETTTSTEAPAETTTSTTAAPDGCGAEPLRVVLVNDDGVVNPAIDVLIDHLSDHDGLDLDLTVVAPAEERSGSSDTTTPDGVTHAEATTPGGHPAHAVDGYPSDAVLVALEDLALDPHLVLSGINPGQNFGPFAAASGTVGAARTAIRHGVPALAVSGGFELDEAQFAVGADLAAEWILEHCEGLLSGEHPTDTLTSINVPACPPEQMGPAQEVQRALELPELPEGTNVFESTCDLADPAPADDIAAVRAGYPAISEVEAEL